MKGEGPEHKDGKNCFSGKWQYQQQKSNKSHMLQYAVNNTHTLCRNKRLEDGGQRTLSSVVKGI